MLDATRIIRAADRAAAALAERRAGMRAYRRAFNQALAVMPGLGGVGTLADDLAAIEDGLPAAHPLRRARRDVIQYQRDHADMAALSAVLLPASSPAERDAIIDRVFAVAMAIERGVDPVQAAADFG